MHLTLASTLSVGDMSATVLLAHTYTHAAAHMPTRTHRHMHTHTRARARTRTHTAEGVTKTFSQFRQAYSTGSYQITLANKFTQAILKY